MFTFGHELHIGAGALALLHLLSSAPSIYLTRAALIDGIVQVKRQKAIIKPLFISSLTGLLCAIPGFIAISTARLWLSVCVGHTDTQQWNWTYTACVGLGPLALSLPLAYLALLFTTAGAVR